MTPGVLVLACLLALSGGEETKLTEAQQAELLRYFGFAPMQIYKISPAIGLLTLADLDADGRTDVLLCNARRSRFELFYQPDPDAPAEPETTELERNEIPNRGNLRIEHVPVTDQVTAVQVAEFTGDDRPDIIYYCEAKELVVLPGLEAGGFGAAERLRAREGSARYGSLAIGDFNHDGRTDVALLGADVLLIYHQKTGGGLAKPVRLVHGIKSPMLMLKADLNGDRRDDLIIGAHDDRYGVYVALQEASGVLAALRPVRIPGLRSMTISAPADGVGGDDLYAIERATGRLRHFRWGVQPAGRTATDWPQRLHSYPLKSKSKRRPLALGDVDGDGRTDCVTVDVDAAQIILFKGEADGLGVAHAFPGLLKTTDVCVADTDFDGRDDVLIASPDEKMIGVSRYKDGRLTFPDAVITQGEPFVVAVGSLEAGGPADRLAYVARDEDEVFTLFVRDLKDGAEDESLSIGELDDDPSGLRFVDVDQDGRNDLLLFVRYAPPRTFLQNAAGEFEVFAGQQTRDWLLKETQPVGFDLADVTGDGKAEVLLAQESLARAWVVRDGHWTVVDQYNAETADSRITGLTTLPGKPGSPTLVMYEQKADELLVQQRRADHTYSVAQSVPVDDFDLTAMRALPIGTTGKTAVLLADANKLAVLTPDDEAPTLVEQHSYETETKRARLADAVIGDVNHDGVRDVVLVDLGLAALEILTTLPGGDYVKATRFQVFQGKRFSDAPERRGEPREVLVGDVTDDGIDDIVLIVHDRLIVYPGQ